MSTQNHARQSVVFLTRHPQIGLTGEGLALLTESYEVFECTVGKDDATLQRSLPSAAILVTAYMAPITSQIMDAAPGLQGIVTFGAGYDSVDVAAATARRIPVSNNPGANAEAVAELAFSMIMSLFRNTCRSSDLVKERRWRPGVAFPPWLRGAELRGKTLGIVGLGNIGRRVARMARGFEMRILAHDPYVSEELARSVGAELADLDTAFAQSDVVSLHVPLMDETRGLVSAERLAMMKPQAYLVNTCRGPVVDENALVAALQEGRIAGAALDVFATEPLPLDHPLLKLDNVILTPHYGGRTAEAKERQSMGVARRITQILNGEVPDNLLNPSVLQERRPE